SARSSMNSGSHLRPVAVDGDAVAVARRDREVRDRALVLRAVLVRPEDADPRQPARRRVVQDVPTGAELDPTLVKGITDVGADVPGTSRDQDRLHLAA